MVEKISQREDSIIRCLLAGLTKTNDISGVLYLQPSTIKYHLYILYQKTYTHDRTQLVLWALKNGYTIELDNSSGERVTL